MSFERMALEGWRDRLRAELEASGRSMRSVSLAARLSPGYLHGILDGGKEPTIGHILPVCRALGVSPVRILFGLEIAPGDLEILKVLQERPEVRQAILTLLGAAPASPVADLSRR